jgi:hypothetical protein
LRENQLPRNSRRLKAKVNDTTAGNHQLEENFKLS